MSYRSSEGDWICEDPECGNYNFAQRLTCNRCKREKSVSKKRKHGHEIGKSAAEKSHGLFSADDWQCEKCGNVNWARRNQCNVCNAPKVTTAEERTGVGGGYNERGNVEYKSRNESDEDYDEFGRRKKKRRHQIENNEKSSGDDSNAYKLKDKKLDNGEKSNKNRMERKENERLKESECWKRRNDSDNDDDNDSDYEKQSTRHRGRRSVSSAASSSAGRVERHESRTKSKSVDPRHDDYKHVDNLLTKRKENENKYADKVIEDEDDDDDDDEEDEDEEEEDEDLSKYDLTNC